MTLTLEMGRGGPCCAHELHARTQIVPLLHEEFIVLFVA